MSKGYVGLLVLVVIIMCGGCASIVSKSQYPVTINSNPGDATVIVKNKQGAEIHKGITPTTITLKSGDGYFSGASYTIECQKEGYYKGTSNLSTQLNPWYWGNILFGGLIGICTVDPLTGAMWKLDETSTVNLIPDPTYISKGTLQPLVKVPLVESILDSVSKQLKDLKDLKDSGILTQDEYETRRKALVDKIEIAK